MALDPDATPEERFRAYLAEHAPSDPLPTSLPWRERWRTDAGTFAALLGVFAMTACLMWLSGKS